MYVLYLYSVFFEQKPRERRCPVFIKGAHISTTTKVYNVPMKQMKNDRTRTAIIPSITAAIWIRFNKHFTRVVLSDPTVSSVSPSVLKNMEEEDVDTCILTGELSSGRIIVASYVGDNSCELNSTR